MADDGTDRDEGRQDETDIGPAERDDALFVNLVVIFQGAAMQQMGKVLNPLSGKIERNLEQARFSIDTLAMLREKTRGNLSGDLERLLESVLVNLRMNFVEEAARPQAESGPEPPAAGSADGAEEAGGARDAEAAARAPGPGAGPGGAEAGPEVGQRGTGRSGGQRRPKSGSKRGRP